MGGQPFRRDMLQLVVAMARTGVVGYGGGPSTIPLIRHEAVHRYKWMEDDEFGEVLAIANALPGPIATKLAAYLGYRLRGVTGSIVAVIAHILPTCAAMIVLFSLLSTYEASPVIAGMIAAVVPVVAVMLGMMAYEFFEKTWKGLGKIAGLLLCVLSFALLQVVALHPAVVIMLFLGYGAVHYRLRDWIKRKTSGE